MEPRLKSLLTLSVLGVLLVIGGAWGLKALTAPFPGEAETPVCVDLDVTPGERIFRGDVTVSVLNAGTRNGLASLTMDLFVDAGFAEGQAGNAEGGPKVEDVEIWTEQPRHPAVQLVAQQLGDAVEVVRRSPTTAGVQVVVGDRFKDLVAGPRKIVARSATEVCGPPVDLG